MIRNQTVYQDSTLSPQKPVWHWSDLFTGPAYIGGMDIDLVGFYAGWHIYVESKPIGMRISKHQSRILETLALRPRTIVLLVGTKNEEGPVVAARWVEVTPDGGWRDPRRVSHGDSDDFREFIADLKRSLDLRTAPANAGCFQQTLDFDPDSA